MGLLSAVFDHDSPAPPALSGGALLGASGVSHPPLQILGDLSGTGAGNSQFNDTNGFGQIDYSTAGDCYIADTANARIKKYSYAAGAWTLASIQTGLAALAGGGTQFCILAINRNTSPNEVHVAAFDHYTDNTWIQVWSLADFGSFSALNRLRQYGSNNAASVAGKARSGISLSIDATHAIVTSNTTSGRNVCWNHQTGALVADASVVLTYSQFANDGADNWWASGDFNDLLRKYSRATLGVLSTLSSATNNQWKPNRTYSANGGSLAYHAGRLYLRDTHGRIQAYDAVTGLYLDTVADPGGLEGTTWTGKWGSSNSTHSAYRNKIAIVVGPDGAAWLAGWNYGSNNATTNCFVTMQPLSTSKATWSKNNWSAGTNTIKSIAVSGTDVCSAGFLLRARRNGGAWVTFTMAQFSDEARWATVGDFTGADLLEIEAQQSTGDRLDGAAGLTFVRDKVSPTNVALKAYYEDTASNVYVPYASGALKGKLGGTGAFRGRLGG